MIHENVDVLENFGQNFLLKECHIKPWKFEA